MNTKDLEIICYKIIIKDIEKINEKIEKNKKLNKDEKELQILMDYYINYVVWRKENEDNGKNNVNQNSEK